MSLNSSWQSVSAGRLWGSRHPAVQPPTGLWPGCLRVRGHERQGSASRLGPDPWLWWQHNLLGKFDSAKVRFVMSQVLSVIIQCNNTDYCRFGQIPAQSNRPRCSAPGPPAQTLIPLQDIGLCLQPCDLPGKLPAVRCCEHVHLWLPGTVMFNVLRRVFPPRLIVLCAITSS